MEKRCVLLLGATGVFGSRLASRLAAINDLSLVLGSRDASRAQKIVDAIKVLRPNVQARAVSIERRTLDVTLQMIKPWAVVDASGPFQNLDYRVAELALAAGCHFIDLADARDYLVGFPKALNDKAVARGLVALTGASSSPALSTAVVADLAKDWRRVDTIDIAITPDGIGDVGASVLLGVLSYAGRVVRQFRFGARHDVWGWMQGSRIDVPRLGLRWVAPVDTCESDVLPSRFGVHSRVTFHAGLESRFEMAGMTALARLRRLGVIKGMDSLIRPLMAGRKVMRAFGGSRGGMVVCVSGLNADGQWSEATWSLLAEHGHGPNVPGLPAVAAIRLLLENKLSPGARIACADIPLSNITAEFSDFAISTQTIVVTPRSAIFDDAVPAVDMQELPSPIIDFHRLSASPVWQGQAKISRSRSLVARFVGWIIGLPDAGDSVPVRVTIEREADGTERWNRSFDGKPFHSVMNRGHDHSFWERFGPLNFKLKLRVENARLIYPVTEARFMGVPVPRFLLPTTEAFETVDQQNRFMFDVKITLPIGGLLVHYQGWLQPALPCH